MLHVSLFVELLRSRPALITSLAALTQTLLWWLVPSLFFSAPPVGLPIVLAVGHEFQLGTYLGPPLAFWIADIVYDIGGISAVYLLSQICVLVTYWAVFRLARAIVGVNHAAIAVLLMVGVFAFTIATPEFGPAVAAMPLTALVLLHFWRAIGEGRRRYWSLGAFEIGLLLLTSYAGLLICGLLVLITAFSQRGRAALGSVDPWFAGIVVVIMMFPHLIWLDAAGDVLLPALRRLGSQEAANTNLMVWLRIAGSVLAVHAGLLLLVLVGNGWWRVDPSKAPVFVRAAVPPFPRHYVYVIAIVPILLASIFGVFFGEPAPVGGTGPLLLLSTLAVVIAAGDMISLRRQGVVSAVWMALLLVPPIGTASALVIVPWVAGVDLAVSQPADAMGRYFADTYQRRTGRPVEIVTGDVRLASLVAMKSPSRPMLYLYETPLRSPWVTAEEIRKHGAMVFWNATDTAGTPPPSIREAFPDLVVDVPRAFERGVQGRTPLLRVGWGMIRPQP